MTMIAMIAAIYARLSRATDETESESIALQIQKAREFAAARGWVVPDEFVFIDDGISGSVWGDDRPGLARLMKAATSASPPFGCLIVRDDERVGRNMWEMGRTLQMIVEVGVRVFLYKSGEELNLDTPIQKVMLSLKGFSGEDYLYKVRTNTKAALRARAEKGFVAGSKVYGYQNHRPGPKAKVTRVIDEVEAAVVRWIFKEYAGGKGIHGIAKRLNADKVRAPRGASWSQGGVAAILRNPIYVGKVLFGRTAAVTRTGGRKVVKATDPSTWVTVDDPSLRVIDQPLWDRVQREREARRGPRGERGRLKGRDPKATIASKYMLTGVSICKACGGNVRATIRGTGSGARRRPVPSYTCATFETRSTCENNVTLPSRVLEDAVVKGIIKYLDDDVLLPALDRALARIAERRGPDAERRVHLEREVARLEAKGRRLAEAIAAGGELGPLVAALKDTEQDKASVQSEIAALAGQTPLDADEIKRRLVAYVKDIKKGLLGPGAGNVLRQIVRGKIAMTPFGSGRSRGYRFNGELAINRLLSGEATPVSAQTRAGR